SSSTWSPKRHPDRRRRRKRPSGRRSGRNGITRSEPGLRLMGAVRSEGAGVLDNRHLLGVVFLVPAALLLLLCLTYPLGLGTSLGFPDTKIGRPGLFVGIENFEFLWGDDVTRLALFNTLFYTLVASVIKFALGLWLALLLNEHLPFKALIRAVALLPFI